MLIKPVARGVESGDRGDCAVRALANATGMRYTFAHSILEDFGREEGCGTDFGVAHQAYTSEEFSLVAHYDYSKAEGYESLEDTLGMKAEKSVTIAQALKKFPKGVFIMGTPAHLFCVKDGKIVDTVENDPKAGVVAVWKFEG